MTHSHLAAVALAVLAGACGSSKNSASTTPDTASSDTAVADAADVTAPSDASAQDTAAAPSHLFPKGFLWGSAIAGFQVDMGCPTLPASECDDPNSDWYQWVTDKALVADPATYNSGDAPNLGPGFWELWPADLDRTRDVLHNNALRYSLEWSRLFPNAKSESATTVQELKQYADPKAVAHYHAMFQGAKARGLQLLITLNHYTLPLWLHDGKACHDDIDACKNRGWADKDRILKAIALYAGYCAAEFGGEVDLWGTLNEPFAVVIAGYLLPSADRTNPPGVALQVDLAIQVAFNMMEAHAKMYDAVHANDKIDADGDGKTARVGVVTNLAAMAPKDPNNPADVAVVKHADWVYNLAFLEATIKGDLDRNLDGVAEEHRADMVGRMDFIGINYYTRLYLKAQAIPGAEAYKFLDFQPDTNLFNTYPEGLREVVLEAGKYGVPLIITENGSGDPKDKSFESFLRPHLAALHQAIQEGAKVEGYFYWTLMDNYEWNHGMKQIKMGLFGLDLQTKARTSSPLAEKYGKVAQDNGF